MDVKDLDTLECQVCQTVIEKKKKFLVSIDPFDRRKYIKFLSGSKDIFIKYVIFVDHFDRRSQAFKRLTAVHVWGLRNRKKYKAIYHKVIRDDKNIPQSKTVFNPDEYLKGES